MCVCACVWRYIKWLHSYLYIFGMCGCSFKYLKIFLLMHKLNFFSLLFINEKLFHLLCQIKIYIFILIYKYVRISILAYILFLLHTWTNINIHIFLHANSRIITEMFCLTLFSKQNWLYNMNRVANWQELFKRRSLKIFQDKIVDRTILNREKEKKHAELEVVIKWFRGRDEETEKEIHSKKKKSHYREKKNKIV